MKLKLKSNKVVVGLEFLLGKKKKTRNQTKEKKLGRKEKKERNEKKRGLMNMKNQREEKKLEKKENREKNGKEKRKRIKKLGKNRPEKKLFSRKIGPPQRIILHMIRLQMILMMTIINLPQQ